MTLPFWRRLLAWIKAAWFFKEPDDDFNGGGWDR